MKFYISWDSGNKDVICSNKEFEFHQYSIDINSHNVIINSKYNQEVYSIISPYYNGYPIHSSVDIYQDNTYKDFFLNVPLIQKIRVELITPTIIKETKKITIIGLVLLSIGLVIYVLKLVILQAT